MKADTLTSRVTDYIFDHIRDNGLSSGDSLPSELRTSTDLNISRGIVREAFCSLEIAGIIEKGNGRSPKVGTLNSDFLTHLLMHALSTRQISTVQVIDLRAAIEVRAAELAALKRTQADVQQMRAATLGMKKSISSPDDFVQHDLSFHGVINGATGNPLLDVMGVAMHGCMQESMRTGLLNRRHKSEVQQIVEAHVAIADAIEERDATKAGKLMKKHFSDARKALLMPPRP